MTLTYNLDLPSPASYEPMTYSLAKVLGQWSVGSKDRMETNGWMDRPSEVIALHAALIRSVKRQM